MNRFVACAVAALFVTSPSCNAGVIRDAVRTVQLPVCGDVGVELSF